MKRSANDSQLATRGDIREIVGEVVDEIMGDALQLISKRFNGIDREIADIKQTINRIDATFTMAVETVNRHSAEIKQLQLRVA